MSENMINWTEMNNDKTYWEALEARFFDGQTTEDEERQLRSHLAQETRRGQTSAGAAYMAYTSVAKVARVKPQRRRKATAWWLSAAASVALALTIGLSLHTGGATTGYVASNGQVVAQSDEALRLMREDLTLLAEACPSVDDDMALMLSVTEY